MSVAVARRDQYVPFGLSDKAISPTADSLRQTLAEAFAGRTSIVVDRNQDAYRLLMKALLEGARDDGVLVTATTLRNALSFLASLPSDVPMPDMIVESDGEIGMDWDEGPRRVLSVSVGEAPMLRFAALIGPEPTHGRVAFSGVVPPTLLFFIRRILAR